MSATSAPFRTPALVLDAYDAMAVREQHGHQFVSQLDPPPGDPRAAHPPGPGRGARPLDPVVRGAGLRLRRWPQAARSARGAAAPSVKPSSASPKRTIRDPAPSLFAADPASAWQPEAAVAPADILMGARVRHRSKGEGTVLSVCPSGKSTELLIGFDATGEASRCIFGYGVLELQATRRPKV